MLAQQCACEQTPPLSLPLSCLPSLPPFLTSIPPSALCAGVSGAGCRLPHQCVTMVFFEVCYSSVAHSPAHWRKMLQTGPSVSEHEEGRQTQKPSPKYSLHKRSYGYRNKRVHFTGCVGACVVLPSRHPPSTPLSAICPAVLASYMLSSPLFPL